MRLWKPKRRWLQFSLRGLLLLTLVVALWLGYEVRQFHRVERATAAIRALGGEVERAPGGWSLAEFVAGGAFGKQIATVEIPGEAIGDAIELLANLPGLSEVRIVYDGSNGIWQNWNRLNAALPMSTILARRHASLPPGESENYNKMIRRVTARLECGNARLSELAPIWKARTTDSRFGYFDEVEYHLLTCSDGTLLELLLTTETNPFVGAVGPRVSTFLFRSGMAVDCMVSQGRGQPDLHLKDLDGMVIPS
jgi:hypothetical protein